MASILPCGPQTGKTYTASGDLSAAQHHIVKESAARTAVICGANEKCVGVLKNEPEDGEQASIVTRGEAEVYVDATTAILIDDFIVANASGHGVKCAEEAGTLYYVLGRAKEAKASGTGTIIVDVEPGVVTIPASET